MISKVPFFPLEVPAKALEKNEHTMVRVRVPNICPLCNMILGMSAQLGLYDTDQDDEDIKLPFVVLKCPNCLGVSFASYEEADNLGEEDLTTYDLYPHPTSKKEFSEDIKEKYPRFCSVYNEALLAEHCQLNEICGMGYRKALEILIKDYAIEKNPDKEEEIKKAMLVNCINNYIKSDKIQALSKASAWLGNDETHYEKRHTGHSVKELKLFIDAVVATIETDITYEKATAFLANN